MFTEKDWFMREIKFAVRGIAQLIFHRDAVSYEVADEARLTTTDLLYRELMALLQAGKICEAEDCLFEHYAAGDLEYLRLALDFYQRLNQMTDGELEENNFSRDEIYESLRDIAEKSGLELYGL